MESEANTNNIETTSQTMQQLLSAEAQARHQIEECQQKAQQQLEAARQTAHHILERANLRIAHIHKMADELVNKEIMRIEQTANDQKTNRMRRLSMDSQQQILEEIAALLTSSKV